MLSSKINHSWPRRYSDWLSSVFNGSPASWLLVDSLSSISCWSRWTLLRLVRLFFVDCWRTALTMGSSIALNSISWVYNVGAIFLLESLHYGWLLEPWWWDWSHTLRIFFAWSSMSVRSHASVFASENQNKTRVIYLGRTVFLLNKKFICLVPLEYSPR